MVDKQWSLSVIPVLHSPQLPGPIITPIPHALLTSIKLDEMDQKEPIVVNNYVICSKCYYELMCRVGAYNWYTQSLLVRSTNFNGVGLSQKAIIPLHYWLDFCSNQGTANWQWHISFLFLGIVTFNITEYLYWCRESVQSTQKKPCSKYFTLSPYKVLNTMLKHRFGNGLAINNYIYNK